MAKKDRPMVLYPAYFDSERSRNEGRRAPKNLAISGPKVEEIHAAARALGLQSVIDPDRAHPSTPLEKEGRVLIQGNYVKATVIIRIAERVKASRAEPARPEPARKAQS